MRVALLRLLKVKLTRYERGSPSATGRDMVGIGGGSLEVDGREAVTERSLTHQLVLHS